MVFNKTYIFDQTHPTNWFHPLGFAYGPDGVYAENDELEKVVVPPGGAPCDETTPCQYPQYVMDGVALTSDPGDDEDFGLDEYEGVYFSGDRDAWLEHDFTVNVTITEPVTTELFYFCHIHNKMSGRIKILNGDGSQKNPENLVPLEYDYHSISEFDGECGTHNVSQFEDAEGCDGMTFLCGAEETQFGKCMEAINCGMTVEMRTSNDLDPTTTFMHQMIAHHRNAVNMAKILLKENPGSLKCGAAYDGRRLQGGEFDDEFCNGDNNLGGSDVVTLLWNIINGQNQQITLMRSWLETNSQPEFNFCEDDSDNALIVGLSVLAAILVLSALGTVFYFKYATKKPSEALTKGIQPAEVNASQGGV
jgi:hypothetical protein